MLSSQRQDLRAIAVNRVPSVTPLYRRSAKLFHEVRAPTSEQLHDLLQRIITRITKWSTLPKAI